ncbi:MAG: OmpA family protein [Gammaproteobacteria bacterium]|nr:OmpA family protein [Gammaproteobacteria bacterium]
MFYNIKRYLKSALLLFLSGGFLTACVTEPRQPDPPPKPAAFKEAVESMVKHLMSQLQERVGDLSSGNVGIALEPFVNVGSGEVLQTSLAIEKLTMQTLKKDFPRVKVGRLGPRRLKESAYILSGVIDNRAYNPDSQTKTEVHYQLFAALVATEAGMVVANAYVWLDNEELDFTPASIYEDSPAYLKGNYVDSLAATVKGQSGTKAGTEYLSSLKTRALLTGAETAYENKDYQRAQTLFSKAEAQPDGKILKTYAGLHNVNYKLGRPADAEKAFAKLLALSIEQNDNIDIRLLFRVNSTALLKGDAARFKQYKMWLRQIGRYFRESQKCIQIIGHSSRSGGAEYNVRLSEARARAVGEMIKPAFPNIGERSQVIGKGFRDNIVGTGADDSTDAVDRRVEFKVVECAGIARGDVI